jgi:glycosyltransferase involved in cell wall biosynthesis
MLDFDISLWYASDAGKTAEFEAQAREMVPAALQDRVKRARWSRRRIDQLSRLPLAIPTRFVAGSADIVYSPDFTIPGEFTGPAMVTVHDLAFEIIPEAYPPGLLSYLRTVVPAAMRKASKVAVVSRTTRIDVVERYNVDAERVVVIPNAADERFFNAAPLSHSRSEQLGIHGNYVLAVGTIEPRKNYVALLSAQERAFQETGRPLVVVGRSGWHNRLELEHLNQLAFTGAVIPLLNAEDDDLPGLYAGADALAYVPLYEGFGLPVLEALAAGTSVITSDIPSVKEIASGFADVVPPRDIEQISAALVHAQAGTPEERKARQLTARTYSWDTSGNILRDTLLDMIK